MAEYAKKKNDELQALCKERGLPHNGKKADLVKRLEDHDAQGTSTKPAVAEDEIDWDEEPATETAKAATSVPNATTIAAGGLGQPQNPLAVPNQLVGEDPTKPDDTVGAAPAAPKTDDTPQGTEAAAEPRKTPEDFTLGLQERTLDEEIAKRKKRAEKFGLDPSTDETLKQLERAKRFGTTVMPGLLNQALPQRAEKEKKRPSETTQDGGIRKRSRQRPGPGSRQGSERKEKPAASKSAIPEPTPRKRGRPKGEAGATPKPNPRSAKSQDVIDNSDDEEAQTLPPPKKAKRPRKSEGSEVKKPKKFRTAEFDRGSHRTARRSTVRSTWSTEASGAAATLIGWNERQPRAGGRAAVTSASATSTQGRTTASLDTT